METNSFNISQYLLHRFYQLGAHSLFGVAGDVVLGFMEQIIKSPIKQINCCNELNAGYAADGYARLHGIGVLVATFNVGPLSALNAIGGSFAEHQPVVVIAGAPERRHALSGDLLHHTLSPDYSIARDMFSKITVATEYLADPAKIPAQIDNALAKCLLYKKPIYLELPADMVLQPCSAPGAFHHLEKTSDPQALLEAQQEISSLLLAAKRPLILLGWEIIRHGLQEPVKALIEKTGYPFCVFPTAKTVISESHPQFVGIYQGNWCPDSVKKIVEESDAILMLGGFFIDSDTGGFTAKLDKNKLIQANFQQIKVKHHEYNTVSLSELIDALKEKLPKGTLPAPMTSAIKKIKEPPSYAPQATAKLEVKRFFKRIETFLRPNDIIVADVGDSLYSTSTMSFPENTTYIAQMFYHSIGYSVGATLGACTEQKRRVLLFVGDGSFQMGAQEISTMIKQGYRPIIFLLNNQGYGIERAIHDGPYNDLSSWRYYLLPQVFGSEPGILVQTEGQLEEALRIAESANKLTFIEVQVDKYDFGDLLRKAGAAMAVSIQNSMEEQTEATQV